MNLEDFDQIELSGDVVGESGAVPEAQHAGGRSRCTRAKAVLGGTAEYGGIEDCGLPPSRSRGDGEQRGQDAKLETGLIVNVPDFIEQGTVVRVDTRTGEVSGAGERLR